MELQNLRGRETNCLCALLFLSSHFLQLMFFSDARDQSWLPDAGLGWLVKGLRSACFHERWKKDAMEKAHAAVFKELAG